MPAALRAVRPRGCTPRAMLLPGLVDIHLHGQQRRGFFRRRGGWPPSLGALPCRARHDLLQPGFADAAEEPAQSGVPHGGQGSMRYGRRALPLCAESQWKAPFSAWVSAARRTREHLRLPDAALFARLQREAAGLIRIACIAPELPGALDCIRTVAGRRGEGFPCTYGGGL